MDRRDAFVSRPTLRPPGSATAPLLRVQADIPALAGLVERAQRFDAAFGPRIQVLFLACDELSLAIPGLSDLPLRFAMIPTGAVVVAYLIETMPVRAALARAVRVTLFRYGGLLSTLTSAESELARGLARPDTIEQLRQQLYLLVNCHEAFAEDGVLAGLFPAPPVVQSAPVGTGSLPAPLPAPDVDVRGRAARLRDALAPGMAQIQAILGIIDHHTMLRFADLSSPTARATRLLALTLPQRPEALARLRDALLAWERYGRLLDTVDGSVEALITLGQQLAAVPHACRQDPQLRDLFPESKAARSA